MLNMLLGPPCFRAALIRVRVSSACCACVCMCACVCARGDSSQRGAMRTV
jgi:hypothetical protein